MPATSIATQAIAGQYSTTGSALTFTAADVGNGNASTLTGTAIILANNTGTTAYTVTITSYADPIYGRTGDVSAQSLASTEIRQFHIPTVGWTDTNSKVYFSASNAAVTFAVIQM